MQAVPGILPERPHEMTGGPHLRRDTIPDYRVAAARRPMRGPVLAPIAAGTRVS